MTIWIYRHFADWRLGEILNSSFRLASLAYFD